ncbi:nuclear transport factor 2 family protein [Flavobacteriaceae bacterium F89]|uniref:Nuclear transport factor 2 family protein n=1 Tax=Cerina litoralis TaxID=2874477 RepID=A0AAE3ETW4_9FLAO|nr:nuclear transport factor 2 family protein [Cerina litoralis]MCG2461030.1 nuclear transport factor 2 family protein [Cerina litoralis]
MKKFAVSAMVALTLATYAQKEKNGTIYDKHPAITVVEDMTRAFVAGDTVKLASYLADDFKSFNGTSSNKDQKGRTKEQFLKRAAFWHDNFDYLSITRSQGAYPDALEYKKSGTWVQTWEQIKGIHKKTGVKLDMPVHRLYVIDKDNKIKTMIGYVDQTVFDEIGNSFVERSNGTIYNHHEYINTVRKMVHAFEMNDMEKMYGFYADDAYFRNINLPDGEYLNLDQVKEIDKEILKNYEINSIDVTGYPDYLHYELGDAKVVQSWWKFRVTRKSDKKEIVLPVFYIHDFNDEGKISSEIVYFSEKLLEVK